MIKKQEKKKTFQEVFRENDACFSMTISEGFANVNFDEKNEMRVQFLDDEGYSRDEMEIPIKDVRKVSKFISDLESLKLSDYTTNA